MSAIRKSAAALILGVAAVTAACSGGGATATSPSGASPSDLAAKPGAPPSSSRTFSVSVSPAEVTVGAATLTFTVSNTSVVDNPQTAGLGSVRIQIPDGLQVTSIANFSGSKPWTYVPPAGQTITVGAAPGNNKLLPGETVTFTVNVTSTVCAKYNIANPQGSNDTPLSYTAGSGGWQYSGSPLSVTVTGCSTGGGECQEDAPAAPAIANQYFKAPVSEGGLGLPANDPRHNQVIVAVAHEQGPGSLFHGLPPCDPGFVAEVRAFVDLVMSQL